MEAAGDTADRRAVSDRVVIEAVGADAAHTPSRAFAALRTDDINAVTGLTVIWHVSASMQVAATQIDVWVETARDALAFALRGSADHKDGLRASGVVRHLLIVGPLCLLLHATLHCWVAIGRSTACYDATCGAATRRLLLLTPERFERSVRAQAAIARVFCALAGAATLWWAARAAQPRSLRWSRDAEAIVTVAAASALACAYFFAAARAGSRAAAAISALNADPKFREARERELDARDEALAARYAAVGLRYDAATTATRRRRADQTAGATEPPAPAAMVPCGTAPSL